MNKPNVLGIARQQLSGSISNFQVPPHEPLQVSPWIAMSLLQKGVRRGQEHLALRAESTLLRISPERLLATVRLHRVRGYRRGRSRHGCHCHGSSRRKEIGDDQGSLNGPMAGVPGCRAPCWRRRKSIKCAIAKTTCALCDASHTKIMDGAQLGKSTEARL